MASVYEATDLRLDRMVAVKVMHPGLGDDDEFAARFVREARAAARISHPNVVAVYDQGNDDGVVFLAMEYIRGHTLRDVIRAEAPIARARALALFEPVLAALAAAHRDGLIHRDVKPENVLHRRRRPDQGRRLRAGQGGQRRHPAHRDRRRADRHRLLPGPRAGRRGPRRRPRRRVRRRRGALRAAHRRQAARGRVPDPGGLQARPRGRAAALGAGARRCRRTSTRWSPGPPPATAPCARPTPACCSTSCAGSSQALADGVGDDPELDCRPAPLPVAAVAASGRWRGVRLGRRRRAARRAPRSTPEPSFDDVEAPGADGAEIADARPGRGGRRLGRAVARVRGRSPADDRRPTTSRDGTGWLTRHRRPPSTGRRLPGATTSRPPRVETTAVAGDRACVAAAAWSPVGRTADAPPRSGDHRTAAARPASGRRASARRSRRGPILLVLALLLALLAGTGRWWFGWGRYTTTPGVVGLTESAAVEKLEAAGLEADTSERPTPRPSPRAT